MTEKRPTSFVVVDDHDLFREGLISLLRAYTGFACAGQGSTSESAIELCGRLEPDLLLLDVELHGDPAVTTVSRLTRNHPRTCVVILTMHDDAVLRRELLKAGASAFVTKSTPSAALVSELVSTLQGARGEAPALARGLLSTRETQVLQLIAEAHSNRVVAGTLNISEGTVKRHLHSIFKKLEARSRLDAVRKGELLGIL